MDYASLPHFCRREGSGSSRHSSTGTDNCYSFDHAFHQELYNYIKEQSSSVIPSRPIKQGSFHVNVPEPNPEGSKFVETIESELQKLEDKNSTSRSLNGLKINGD